MQRYLRVLGLMLLAGCTTTALFVYIRDRERYDPEQVCAQQTDLTQEECLHDIALAQSAGW